MRIGVWGDSITFGACDTECLGWVGRLRKALFTQYEGTSVYNRGISGDTSQDLMKRFPVELASLAPEVVIIAIGINDTVYRESQEDTDVPLTEFKENIKELVRLARAQSKRMYIVGLTNVIDELLQPFPWSSSGKCYANAVIERFNRALEELCAELDVPYISTYGTLAAEDLADGIHPNAAGYDKLEKLIQSRIELP